MALEGLSPELQLFCLLKTMANFGVRLTWSNLQKALSQAVEMHSITDEQRRLCNSVFEKQAEDKRAGISIRIVTPSSPSTPSWTPSTPSRQFKAADAQCSGGQRA